MIGFEVWALFVVTESILCLTPGPAVLLVVAQALGRGAAASVWATLGILTGNVLYFALSATASPRFARLADGLAGTMLVTAGVGLAAVRRS